MTTTSPKLVLLFGGSSDERKVSVASAQNIARELPGSDLWFLAKDGKVFSCTPAQLAAHDRPFENEFIPSGAALHRKMEEAVSDPKVKDAVFVLALHGGEGEDGTLQKLFETKGIAFTGSGSDASAKAFDKTVAKRIAKRAGIAVAEDGELEGGDAEQFRNLVPKMFRRHGYLILKPVAGGSSIGVIHLKTEKDIDELAWEKYGGVPYLVEAFLSGRELTVGVYDDGMKLFALPPSEVRTDAQHSFDYNGKYLGKGSQEITPAPLDLIESEACQKLAATAHRALGCEGYSRTDMILTSQGPVFLETNTLPGLTRASFIPQQLAAANIPFRTFLDDQIGLAVRRRTAQGRKAAG